MQVANETLVILWLGAGAVALWMLLPALLNALGLTFWQSAVDDEAAALEPSGDDAEYEELFEQLRGLGFAPVGRRSTTGWLFLHHWYKNFQSRIFAAAQGDCLALVYKLRSWDRWRLCFVTAFSDGAIVETANQMESLRIDEPDHLRWGLATPDRSLLLARHREECEKFAAKGARQVALLPVEQVNQRIVEHAARHHRKGHRWTGLRTMSLSLWGLGLGFLVVRPLAQTAPYLLPLVVMAWGCLWPAVHAYLFRAAAARLRARDAHHRHTPQGAGTCSRA